MYLSYFIYYSNSTVSFAWFLSLTLKQKTPDEYSSGVFVINKKLVFVFLPFDHFLF